MSDVVWTALIVAFFGLLTTLVPVVLARQTNRARAAEKEADYARQDEVAARVEKAARATEEVSKTLATATQITNDKLDGVVKDTKATHTFLNSEKTQRIKRELGRARRELTLINEVVRLNRVAHLEPDSDALASIAEAKTEIAALEAQLSDQLAATEAVEKQQEQVR